MEFTWINVIFGVLWFVLNCAIGFIVYHIMDTNTKVRQIQYQLKQLQDSLDNLRRTHERTNR